MPRGDLDLLAQSPEQFVTNKLALALLGLFVPLVPAIGWVLMGLSVPLVIFAIAGVLLAPVLWFVPDWAVKSEAAKARTEFAHAAAAWMDLVATRIGHGGPSPVSRKRSCTPVPKSRPPGGPSTTSAPS